MDTDGVGEVEDCQGSEALGTVRDWRTEGGSGGCERDRSGRERVPVRNTQ